MGKGMFAAKPAAEKKGRKPCGINAGELKRKLADIDDDAEVLLSVNGGREGLFEVINVGTEKRRKIATLWGNPYQTREVNNAYGCNDDRYGGSVFLIEVGEESP
jgi:hypothetical protein